MNFFEEEEEKSLVYSAGVGANNRVPNDESQAWLMQMRDPGGREEKYRERTGFATRSPARSSKERKKSVLKFWDPLRNSYSLRRYRKIFNDQDEYSQVFEFDGEKKLADFSEFFKNCGGKLGDKKEKKSANVLTRDGQTLAWLAFFSARPGSPLNEGKNSLEFHSGGSPASNSIPDLLCPAAQCPEDSCAPSARRFLTNEWKTTKNDVDDAKRRRRKKKEEKMEEGSGGRGEE